MMTERPDTFVTAIPARLDRLPWSRFHWLVVFALGVTWILDGLEVTLVGSLAPAIQNPKALGLSDGQIGLTGSAYIAGAVMGALVFGRLTDTFGRRRLFTITVAVYLLGTIATGFSWDFWSFVAFRFVTGMGIGGEYGAVNSAIQELIPARRRGFTDLAINGSFWVGAALGAMASLVVLDPDIIAPETGWRAAFVVGGLLALIVIWVRRYIPESPRWLMTHGQPDAAHTVVDGIEAQVEAQHGKLPPAEMTSWRFSRSFRTGWGQVFAMLLRRYPRRTVLGITLMATQAFCYNAIFFTYALILSRFYNISDSAIGWFILPFEIGRAHV